jgi:hypothetical protein
MSSHSSREHTGARAQDQRNSDRRWPARAGLGVGHPICDTGKLCLTFPATVPLLPSHSAQMVSLVEWRGVSKECGDLRKITVGTALHICPRSDCELRGSVIRPSFANRRISWAHERLTHTGFPDIGKLRVSRSGHSFLNYLDVALHDCLLHATLTPVAVKAG